MVQKLTLTFVSTMLLLAGLCQQKKAVATSFSLVSKESFVHLPAHSIMLYDNWQMRESAICGNDGEKLSMVNYKPLNWYTTSVPATTLAVLVKNGIYPDPYIGFNTMKIPDVSDDFNKTYDLSKYSHMPEKSNPWKNPYWFRKVFALPADFKGKTIWLNLDGINYRADVWVNGKQIAKSDTIVGMFRRFKMDISSVVRSGEKNAIAIRIHPLDFSGNPLHVQSDGLTGILGPNGGDGEILKNVTQYCTIGWDWIPQVPDRNMGIWQHIWLNATGPVKLSDPAAFTDLNLPDTTMSAITIRFFAENPSSKDLEIKVRTHIQPDGFNGKPLTIQSSHFIKARSKVEVILKPEEYPELHMQNPALWWPLNYGSQPLYKLKIESSIDGDLSSETESRFGVRKLGTYVLPSGGRAFTVNGQTIRVTGGAWVPDFLMTWSAQRYRDEVRLMAEGNATFVRVNGCGIVPPDVFFEACDEYGLLVWQDLSRTSITSKYRKDGINSWSPPNADSLTYIENMKDCIARLRGHASLFLWCGGNEAAPQANTGKALQNQILPQMDGTRIFLPSSSDQPDWSGIEIRTYTFGPWDMKRLPAYNYLYDTAKQFTSKNEIGLTSVQNINAVAASVPDYDQPDPRWYPLNMTMGFHDATGFPIQALDKIMREDIGSPASLAEYLVWGDLYNNQTYRAIFEAANKARPRNAGTMLWKSNAAWPGFNWQIFDWNLKPNAGYYSMKSACKPLHIQLSHDDFSVQVISTLYRRVPGLTARITVMSGAGKTEAEIDYRADIDTNSTSMVGLLPKVVQDGKMHFISLSLLDQQGDEIDRTVTWFQKEAKWQELTRLVPVNIDATLISQKVEKGEKVLSFLVHNKAATPAINITFEIIRGSQGREILPSFWDDNALTLMPGEKKKITVRIKENQWPANPFLMIEGLNVNPVELNLITRATSTLLFKINDISILQKEGKSYLSYRASRAKGIGTRITYWPVAVEINSKLYRFTITGIKEGGESAGLVELTGIQPGVHEIKMGTLVKKIEIK